MIKGRNRETPCASKFKIASSSVEGSPQKLKGTKGEGKIKNGGIQISSESAESSSQKKKMGKENGELEWEENFLRKIEEEVGVMEFGKRFNGTFVRKMKKSRKKAKTKFVSSLVTEE